MGGVFLGNTEELIEFVLGHEAEIRAAVVSVRCDPGGCGHTGGDGSGHSRVSDPTAQLGIRAVMAVPCVYIEYGSRIAGYRMVERVRNPEKWLCVIDDVRCYCKDRRGYSDFFVGRYVNGDAGWREYCRVHRVSKAVYYAIKRDIVHFAELCAVGYGLINPFARLRR